MDDYGHIEKIDAYLKGELQGESLLAFEKELQTNTALKNEVLQQQQLRDMVIGAELLSVREQMQQDLAHKHGTWKPWMGPALGVLVLGIMALTYMLPKQKNSSNEGNAPISKQSVNHPPSIAHQAPQSHQVSGTSYKPLERTEKTLPHPSETTKPSLIEAIEGQVQEEITATETPSTQKEEPTSEDQPAPEAKETPAVSPEAEERLTETPLPLAFQGELRSFSADYQQSNGSISIKGIVSGGTPPYQFFVNEELPQESIYFNDLIPGTYSVKAIDKDGGVILLGQTIVHEKNCLTDYDKSLNPTYDGAWEIPITQDQGFTLRIMGQAGEVFHKQFDSFDTRTWDATGNNGELVPSGYYRFEIVYENSEQCLGELTITY